MTREVTCSSHGTSHVPSHVFSHMTHHVQPQGPYCHVTRLEAARASGVTRPHSNFVGRTHLSNTGIPQGIPHSLSKDKTISGIAGDLGRFPISLTRFRIPHYLS